MSIIISVAAFGMGIFSNDGGMSAFTDSCPQQSEYIRIHIRADSNESEAQAVKYKVRDAVVEFLTPLVAEYESKKEAVAGVEENLSGVEYAASEVLRKNGIPYGATARLGKAEFPSRVYEGYTLPAGEYTALIVCLGSGKGDNWWCVVYPPLCFAATGQNVVYKSKIKEIIDRFYR
jgi:stage II sporulation protein R